MNRIQQALTKKAFIAYITAGNPSTEQTIAYALALANAGVNILELGIPFSDPVADGPVIQQAMQQALANNTRIDDVFTMVKRIREQSNIAIILFSYYNPILTMGEQFYQKAAECGVDGLLVVDLPIEEQHNHNQYCSTHKLDSIQIISTASSDARIKDICQHASGFLYYACQKGTTGGSRQLPDDYAEHIQMIRKHSKLPIATGFGIANKAVASEVLSAADAFVVGSLLVNATNDHISADALATLAQNIDPR